MQTDVLLRGETSGSLSCCCWWTGEVHSGHFSVWLAKSHCGWHNCNYMLFHHFWIENGFDEKTCCSYRNNDLSGLQSWVFYESCWSPLHLGFSFRSPQAFGFFLFFWISVLSQVCLLRNNNLIEWKFFQPIMFMFSKSSHGLNQRKLHCIVCQPTF